VDLKDGGAGADSMRIVIRWIILRICPHQRMFAASVPHWFPAAF
jgi:hypothetical protein